MTTRISTRARSRLSIAVGAATIAALLAAGAAPASANAREGAAAETAECSFGQHVVHAWLRLPGDLRQDLRQLGELEPGEERAEEARRIRESARDGDYGPRVEHRSEKVQARRMRVLANLPDELRVDLAEIRAAEPQDRRALAEVVAGNALDGDYGPRIEAFAERVKASDAWQECTE